MQHKYLLDLTGPNIFCTPEHATHLEHLLRYGAFPMKEGVSELSANVWKVQRALWRPNVDALFCILILRRGKVPYMIKIQIFWAKLAH